MKPVYRIREHGSFITGREVDGCTTLPPETFRQLENFVLSQHSGDTHALDLMGLSARKGVGRVITARNDVGVLVMQDGTTIEILPKIHSAIEDDDTGTKAKKLLINMLQMLRDSPCRNLQTASVDVKRLNIFEVFIRMFVDEVLLIVKRGLRCQYDTIEENAPFFKGKMVFAQQLRQNLVHRERSYVVYDAFTTDRPENRLLKSTIQLLYRHAGSTRNRNDLKLLLNAFADVRPLSKCCRRLCPVHPGPTDEGLCRGAPMGAGLPAGKELHRLCRVGSGPGAAVPNGKAV